MLEDRTIFSCALDIFMYIKYAEYAQEEGHKLLGLLKISNKFIQIIFLWKGTE